ncbi:hypothetical protein P170DRAFT_473028 [Aspergillus steynii IBT 23096]|uniref:Uncharacterized protein n=1 Tax=Aspergillus steynii IBT 23096 TaxID=1392250 RepID=A0A2I2GJU6_9EURO|nr:uncharacterized protein P170DRAFT_473028 [Aspergillus steynii IBT 23096]PLB53151.1 hypothetical protein P170DRAFT_473028 [Aspergillus steynii IBT 23096]
MLTCIQESLPSSSASEEEGRIEEPVAQDEKSTSEPKRKRPVSPAMERIRQRIKNKWLLISAGSSHWNEGREPTEETFELLRLNVGQWAMSHAASEASGLDHLSEDQESAIISSLNDFCVQESWDTLVARVPGISDGLVAEPFVMAMVFQDLHNRIIERPFWYLDGKSARDETGDDTFGERLEYLYGKFLKTNPIMAEYWMRETVRLSNSIHVDQAPDTAYGRYNEERRDAAAARLADDLLASKPIQSLLKTPANDDIEKKRREALIEIYRRAAAAAVFSDQCTGQTKFLKLADIAPTYHASSSELISLEYHGMENGDTRLDGHRILLVVRPGLLRKSNQDSTEFETWLPAIVMMKDDEINQCLSD